MPQPPLIKPTFDLLKALDADSMLADTPIYARIKRLQEMIGYDLGDGNGLLPPVAVLHELQRQTSAVPRIVLLPSIPPGSENTYHIDLTMSLETIVAQIQRLTVMSTAFLGHLKAVASHVKHKADIFSVWWLFGLEEIVRVNNVQTDVFTVKNQAILAEDAFTTCMGEVDMEVDSVIDATTLLVANLKGMLMSARETYQLGRDQINVALADSRIPNAGLHTSTPATLQRADASPYGAGHGTLSQVFGGRVLPTPTEDDDFPLADESDAAPDAAPSDESTPSDPAPADEPAPDPKPKVKRTRKPKQETPVQALPPAVEVTEDVRTDDPFASVTVTRSAIPVHEEVNPVAPCCERDVDGDGNCDRHPNGIPEAEPQNEELPVEEPDTQPEQPAEEPESQVLAEEPPTAPAKTTLALEDDDFPLASDTPAPAKAPTVEPDDDDFLSGDVAVVNVTPATKELKELAEGDDLQAPVEGVTPPPETKVTEAPAPSTTSQDTSKTAKPYRPNGPVDVPTVAASTGPVAAPTSPVALFRPKPGAHPIYHQQHPPLVLPKKKTAPDPTPEALQGDDEPII